jgi:hypothetical protein
MSRINNILKNLTLFIYFGFIFYFSVLFANDFFDSFLIKVELSLLGMINIFKLPILIRQLLLIFYADLGYPIYFFVITTIIYTFHKSVNLNILVLMYIIFRVLFLTLLYKLCGCKVEYQTLPSLFLEIPVTFLFMLFGRKLGVYISDKVMSS